MTPNNYRIVFFGTSEFAAIILRDILDLNLNVVACVTRPDRATGRNLKLSYSPVKQYCLEQSPHIPVYQPEKVSTEEFQGILTALKPDLFVVAAFGEIIKNNILQIPEDGSINVHPSLLPKYRGPSPLQAALLNGDEETGVCVIDVASKMDAGVIFASQKFPIDAVDNFTSLQAKALKITKSLVGEVINRKINKTCVGQAQDESKVTFCKKITVDDEKIDWSRNLVDIHNQIRALSEHPGAWSYIEIGSEVKRVKIYHSSLYKESEGGVVLHPKKHISISKDGYTLVINSLQVEGKKRLSSVEFLSGVKSFFKFVS